MSAAFGLVPQGVNVWPAMTKLVSKFAVYNCPPKVKRSCPAVAGVGGLVNEPTTTYAEVGEGDQDMLFSETVIAPPGVDV